MAELIARNRRAAHEDAEETRRKISTQLDAVVRWALLQENEQERQNREKTTSTKGCSALAE